MGTQITGGVDTHLDVHSRPRLMNTAGCWALLRSRRPPPVTENSSSGSRRSEQWSWSESRAPAAMAPELIERVRVGTDTAGALLAATGENTSRIHSGLSAAYLVPER